METDIGRQIMLIGDIVLEDPADFNMTSLSGGKWKMSLPQIASLQRLLVQLYELRMRQPDTYARLHPTFGRVLTRITSANLCRPVDGITYPKFDFDCPGETHNTELRDILYNCASACLQRFFPTLRNDPHAEYVLTSACHDSAGTFLKNSWHLVVHSDLAVTTYGHMLAVRKELIPMVDAEIAGQWGIDREDIKKIIDKKIYQQNGLRLMYTHKGNTREAVPRYKVLISVKKNDQVFRARAMSTEEIMQHSVMGVPIVDSANHPPVQCLLPPLPDIVAHERTADYAVRVTDRDTLAIVHATLVESYGEGTPMPFVYRSDNGGIFTRVVRSLHCAVSNRQHHISGKNHLVTRENGLYALCYSSLCHSNALLHTFVGQEADIIFNRRDRLPMNVDMTLPFNVILTLEDVRALQKFNHLGIVKYLCDNYGQYMLFDKTAENVFYVWRKCVWEQAGLLETVGSIMNIVGMSAVDVASEFSARFDDDDIEFPAYGFATRVLARASAKRLMSFTNNLLSFTTVNAVSRLLITNRTLPQVTGEKGWHWNDRYLNFQNGMLDLETNELIPHDPLMLCINICGCDWTGVDTDAPVFKKFLLDITGDVVDGGLGHITGPNPEVVEFLQMTLGHTLRPSTRTDYDFLLFYGPHGRGGKSVMARIISTALGTYAANGVNPTLLTNNRSKRQAGEGTPSPQWIELMNKLVVFTEEPREGDSLDVGIIKHITDGGTGRMQRGMYAKKQTKVILKQLWGLGYNKNLELGSDPATWTRLRIFKFMKRYLPTPDPQDPAQVLADPKIEEKCKEELSGIVAWIVSGLKLPHRIPNKIATWSEEMRTEEDVLATFLEERCEVLNTFRTRVSALFASYQSYFMVVKKTRCPISSREFRKQLPRFSVRDVGNLSYYTNYSVMIDVSGR